MTIAHPLVRRTALAALFGLALALILSLGNAPAQAQSSSVNIINALSSQGYYLSPQASSELSGAGISDADSKLKNAVNNLKGKGYDVKIGVIVSSDIPLNRGNLANYCQYLHDYLNMGNGILVLTAIDGSINATSTKLSSADITNALNDSTIRASLTKNVVDGTIAFTTALDDKILGNDSTQRNSFITIAAIVVIIILVVAFLTLSGLNARWAIRLNAAKKLSSDLSGEVVQMGGNLDFLKMQNQQAYDQVTAQLNPGNQLLSEANTQLSQLKSPGFFALIFQYTKLDHDLHDVEAALQSAKGEIDQALQVFNANWTPRNAKVAGQP